MNNEDFFKEFLIAYEDYKNNKILMDDDCFRYNYKSHNNMSKMYIKKNINEYIDNCTDIQELQGMYNKIKKQNKENKINKWIESVRTIECGDYVTDAFDFLWNIDDDDIWYKIAEELANIVEYAVCKSEYKDEHQKKIIEEYINK